MAEPYFGAAFGVDGADFLAGTVEVPRRAGFLCVCISLVTFFKPKMISQKLLQKIGSLQITSTFSNVTTLVDRGKERRVINFGCT